MSVDEGASQMPKLTVGGQTAEWPADKRLVNAIEEMGVHIGHRCGGNARCTTCRVAFTAGEPETITTAEHAKLVEREIYGQFRLACQICVGNDMEVEAIMTVENQGWTDAGGTPDAAVHPEAVWLPKAAFDK
jgi:ferredoxin